MPIDKTNHRSKKQIYCTACKIIKDQDEFDGSQLKKRFGRDKTSSKAFMRDYDPESERDSKNREGVFVKKVWCLDCIPKPTNDFFCSQCEKNLPRAKFARAQLSKHKSDDDRLCIGCADLSARVVEAVREGKEFQAQEIEEKLEGRCAPQLDLSGGDDDDDDE
ncbi:hypothetical protein BY996DRAFT_525445 [Phakopsora pachyrhizi]|nr:hypothetical protein BY996DRAFT_525445 [Phakopsora pachyrhizi]